MIDEYMKPSRALKFRKRGPGRKHAGKQNPPGSKLWKKVKERHD